ncbi:MAG: type I glyceraldehyde-3-phosphate dehydrogenase [Candidatus Heimdallarchaeota archaeon]|nr:type I glyceraldehyde-3-phosphate dehydrogenase [Candidatus Heimdallarchaeota archaeon]
MVVKVGINGFGRIGRLVLRALLEMDEQVDIVAINDIAPNESLAHMFEFDSIHGRFDGTVEVNEKSLIFNDDEFVATSEKDPLNLPWKEFDTDIVIECTGRFRTRSDLQKHIQAGAKRVILSAPGKTAADVDLTVVRGVNNDLIDVENQKLISNASCTTNCLAPVAKVLDDNFGFEHGTMTTIHSYTNDQRLLDSIHSDYRRMRSAAMNMFPTSTGATKAIGLVLPNLAGKIDGLAIRVPLPNVSIVDLTVKVTKDLTIDELTDSFRKASENDLKGILGYEWRSLVSTDFNHNPLSAVVDFPALKIVDACMAKVLAWYDNEWGYVSRIAELTHEVYDKGKSQGVF